MNHVFFAFNGRTFGHRRATATCKDQPTGFLLELTAWPAMRVISLGIRTVPVLSVAKKFAAARPTPTAPTAKCGLIRQDEAD